MSVVVQVIYDPDSEARDITNHVIISSAQLQSAVNAQPGTWQATVRDLGRNQSFVTGKRIIWKVDGQILYGGFLTQVSKSFLVPADNTNPTSSVKTRSFILRGVDYNILFDKRIFRDPTNYLSNSQLQFNRAFDNTLINTLFTSYIDTPSWLNYTTHVPAVSEIPTDSASAKGAWVQQGSTLRSQMDELSKVAGAAYYIKPTSTTGAALYWVELENNTAPYVLSDKPTGAEKGFRELDDLEDATGMVNDALIWGGSPFSASATTVFGRVQNASSITAHNRWQWAETHFNDPHYATTAGVTARANVIVKGQTGDRINDQNRGLENPVHTYRVTWFERNIPISGGNFQFIQPGDLTTLRLYVFGSGGTPYTEILPCRQLTISFPLPARGGEAHVKFEATFSLQLNDPYTLWRAVAALRRKAGL